MIDYQNILLGGSLLWFIGLFMIDSRHLFSFFPGSLIFKRLLTSNFSEKTMNSSKKITKWAIENKTNLNISHHWWYLQLPEEIKTEIDVFTKASEMAKMFSTLFHPRFYDIIIIPEMNELYITGEDRGNDYMQSDRVFFIPHIDGPFMWIPFVSVYRCLIGLNNNNRVVTHFPMNQTKVVLQKNNILAFDFNREIHYITFHPDEVETEPRITFKVHYCIYPKMFSWLGKAMYFMNVKYNQAFRNLFLETIQPNTYVARFKGYMVVLCTHAFVYIETYVGYGNLCYYLMLERFVVLKYISNTTLLHLMYFPCVFKYITVLGLKDKELSPNYLSYFPNVRDMVILYVFTLWTYFSIK